IFAADLNTPYNHQNILADNVFTFDYEDEGLYCVWENQQVQDDPLNRIDMFLEFFELLEGGNYKRSSDSLSEIALSPEKITKMLIRAGFDVLECSEYLTGEELEEYSEKFTIITKK
ncbi:MAG: class I SAM-dependent methyltransferase, partial [Ruminiclostridium sp.]|nr:class I SAM-dependent methyltransferase [Ruminiclostridium sp.]